MAHPYLTGAGAPRVFAHRGLVPIDATAITENSFAAIAAAQAAGAIYVESDCRLTRDGVVVLFHDADLTRVAGDPRLISQITSRELADLMADRGGVATLEQALSAFPDVRFNIDVKSTDAAEPAGAIVAPHAERVLLTSFSDQRRRRALSAAAAVRADLLPATSGGSGSTMRAIGAIAAGGWRARRTLAGLDALQVPERQGPVRVVTRRLIEVAHRAGVEVHVWTVNDPVDMERLVALGVDGIVTDRADLALATFRAGG